MTAAFAFTKNPEIGHALPLQVVVGILTGTGGSTGGAIDTGLEKVLFFLTDKSITSYTVSGGIVTIVTSANLNCNWMAIGY